MKNNNNHSLDGFEPELVSILQGCEQVDIINFETNFVKTGGENRYVLNADNELTHLLIRGNKSIDLIAVTNCVSLVVLKLYGCSLSQLPDSICQLQNLRTLHLSSNMLYQLPNSISKLRYLKELYLTGNQFVQIPGSIFKLRHLNRLYFGNNMLTELPISIANLKELKECYLFRNQLERLPATFGQLNGLNVLALEGNKLSSLPASLNQLNQLNSLRLHGNSFPINMGEIKNLSPQEQINYILKIQQGETTPLKEAKVLVVGEERVGKTSLIRRLQGLPHNPDEISTEGINISPLTLDNGIAINIWDFAGQEITHQTHQFFLTNRSLYLLIVDAQKEDDDAKLFYWLTVIKAYGGDTSPIIVVVNQRDKNLGYQFDFHRYQRDFNIVAVLYTTACLPEQIERSNFDKIEHGIEDLAKCINKHVAHLDGIDFPLPHNWATVKGQLQQFQQDKRDFIQQTEYQKLCVDAQIEEQKDQKTLLKLLNEIGTVVAYPDERRLRLTQVINPLWVTAGVYKIVRSSLVKDGLLKVTDIEGILRSAKDYQYQDDHLLWLMALLNQFELSFTMDDETLLLPSKLSAKQPDIDFDHYQQGLNFRFDYHNLLKKSVIWQLTVKLHRYVDQSGEKYWRRGVFLGLGDCKAVVIADENKKIIDIAIDNNSRSARELLTLIRDALNTINGKNLHAVEKIPLIVDGIIKDYEDYKHLLNLVENNITDHPKSFVDTSSGASTLIIFPIRQLIDGYKPQIIKPFDYEQLTIDLLTTLAVLTRSALDICLESENQINTRIRDGLTFHQYEVSDQSLMGRTVSGKQQGETDLVVKNKLGVVQSIIEALILSTCDTANIEKHYTKLTEYYDTLGCKRNFILIYAKAVNFSNLWDNYKNYCNQSLGGISDQSERYNSPGNIRIGSTMFEGRDVMHICVNFKSKELN